MSFVVIAPSERVRVYRESTTPKSHIFPTALVMIRFEPALGIDGGHAP